MMLHKFGVAVLLALAMTSVSYADYRVIVRFPGRNSLLADGVFIVVAAGGRQVESYNTGTVGYVDIPRVILSRGDHLSLERSFMIQDSPRIIGQLSGRREYESALYSSSDTGAINTSLKYFAISRDRSEYLSLPVGYMPTGRLRVVCSGDSRYGPETYAPMTGTMISIRQINRATGRRAATASGTMVDQAGMAIFNDLDFLENDYELRATWSFDFDSYRLTVNRNKLLSEADIRGSYFLMDMKGEPSSNPADFRSFMVRRTR